MVMKQFIIFIRFVINYINYNIIFSKHSFSQFKRLSVFSICNQICACSNGKGLVFVFTGDLWAEKRAPREGCWGLESASFTQSRPRRKRTDTLASSVVGSFPAGQTWRRTTTNSPSAPSRVKRSVHIFFKQTKY